jgi:hypothetical protein
MYKKNLRNAGHTRRFEIRETGGAWLVQTEHDSRVVKRVQYDDWHRVERSMLAFAAEVSKLERAGWVAD